MIACACSAASKLLALRSAVSCQILHVFHSASGGRMGFSILNIWPYCKYSQTNFKPRLQLSNLLQGLNSIVIE